MKGYAKRVTITLHIESGVFLIWGADDECIKYYEIADKS